MSAPKIDRVTVFDIETECGAAGCDRAPEVLLVAGLTGGGFATRWVCRKCEAGAPPEARDPVLRLLRDPEAVAAIERLAILGYSPRQVGEAMMAQDLADTTRPNHDRRRADPDSA